MPPFRMHEVRELIRLIDESNIEEFELDNEGAKIVIKKMTGTNPEQVSGTPILNERKMIDVLPATNPSFPVQELQSKPREEESVGSDVHKIVSPMVGTFYVAASPEADPYVSEGDRVEGKTVVCIVEAMKLMNEIEAEVSGVITKVLVANGELVEYGQPLFLVKRS